MEDLLGPNVIHMMVTNIANKNFVCIVEESDCYSVYTKWKRFSPVYFLTLLVLIKILASSEMSEIFKFIFNFYF